eukprot:337047-Prorocentrum_minimum.AAC.2
MSHDGTRECKFGFIPRVTAAVGLGERRLSDDSDGLFLPAARSSLGSRPAAAGPRRTPAGEASQSRC